MSLKHNLIYIGLLIALIFCFFMLKSPFLIFIGLWGGIIGGLLFIRYKKKQEQKNVIKKIEEQKIKTMEKGKTVSFLDRIEKSLIKKRDDIEVKKKNILMKKFFKRQDKKDKKMEDKKERRSTKKLKKKENKKHPYKKGRKKK